MKKFVIYLFSSSILLVSCKSTRLVPFSDDVYADPIEEKRIAKANAEAQKKKEMEEEAAKQAEYAAQKAKDDANPYYKDPNYAADDYYDYAYAAQIKRFHNPIYGTGYYDDYYTNSYWYNQNPACYGNSIYNGYNWWPNSPYTNYGYGNCWNNNFGYNNFYNPYNPYYSGWNSGVSVGLGYSNYYNPYWNSPFCTNMMYYGNYGNYGYNNPYYNNWGYFNSLDNNSNYTYAPRTGNAGSNSRNETFAGMKVQNGDNERVRFINQMVAAQETTPKFTTIERKVSNTTNGGNYQPASNNGAVKTMGNNESNNGNVRNSGNYTPSNNNAGYNTNQNNTTVKQQPVKQPNKTSTNTNNNSNPAPVKINNNNYNTGNNEGFIRGGGSSGGSSGGGSSGGSSSPRNSGGGGTSKPR